VNIFVLSEDPKLAAIMLCDKHISKMILESAQMICATINERGGSTPYKTTHKNHPCTIWTRASQENFHWLTDHAKEMNYQYRWRYKKNINHKSWEIIKNIVRENKNIIKTLPDIGPTAFAQAMPEDLRIKDNAVQAYRNYYRTKDFASWSKGTPAPWWW
jgi:Pyrimidine dimer DNA glycosylase